MFREAFILNIPTTILAAGTGTAFTEVDVRMPDFDFEFRRTIHTATSDLIYKKIFDANTSKYLFNGAPDLRSVSGKALSGITPYGFLPFNWPIPYTIKKRTLAGFFLSDFSGAPNTLDLSYHGIGIYDSTPFDSSGKPVDYNIPRAYAPMVIQSDSIIAAAGVGSINEGYAVIKEDADFVCTKITGISTGDGYVQIKDTNRGLDWQQGATRISNLVGNGQFPNVLIAPRFIRANTNLTITWTNNTAPANTLTLFFHGYKRFAA